MYTIEIPGRGPLQLSYAVFDFNGTLADGGELLSNIGVLIMRLSSLLECVVLTADTFGSVHEALKTLPVHIDIIHTGTDKANVIKLLRGGVVVVGNGRNDYEMMTAADLSIITAGPEGTAAKSIMVADIFVPNIYTAFDLLLQPKKVIATLRS